jgi:hypothetical protein
MTLEVLDKIKRIILIGLVSDDELMETLVLKGGNALSMIYGLNNRGSYDLDFSMEDDFNEEIKIVMDKIEKNLASAFSDEGYTLFEFKYSEQPHIISEDVKSFWGGYYIEFKIVETPKFSKSNLEKTRRNALRITPTTSPKFTIDISKHEYIKHRTIKNVDGYSIYVYAPEMILFEKARAICQQNNEYSPVVHSQIKPKKDRARDFYDIYNLLEYYQINLHSDEKKELIKNIFNAKRVPLNYIKLVPNYREKHRQGFASLIDTVTVTESLKEFDFYFDYFMENFIPFSDL